MEKFTIENGTEIYKENLKVTRKGNPVIDMAQMGIEAIYVHETMPDLVLFQSKETIIVKPHKGLIIQFKGGSTLYRMIKQCRHYEGDLLEAQATGEIEYWMALVQSYADIENNNFNKIKMDEMKECYD